MTRMEGKGKLGTRAKGGFDRVNIFSGKKDFINIFFNFKPFNNIKFIKVNRDIENFIVKNIKGNINAFDITNKLELTKLFNKSSSFVNRTIIEIKGSFTSSKNKSPTNKENENRKKGNNIDVMNPFRINKNEKLCHQIRDGRNYDKEEDNIQNSSMNRVKKSLHQSVKTSFKERFKDKCYKGGDSRSYQGYYYFVDQALSHYYATSKGSYSMVVAS